MRRVSGIADFSLPAWLTACRENRKPEGPWQCLSYSVKDIDGHVVAVSYRGQEKKIAIAGATPVISTGHVDGRPGRRAVLPAERNADGALAVGFVVAGANRVAPPMETHRHGRVRGLGALLVQKRTVRSLNRLLWANLFSRSGNIPSLLRVYNRGASRTGDDRPLSPCKELTHEQKC